MKRSVQVHLIDLMEPLVTHWHKYRDCLFVSPKMQSLLTQARAPVMSQTLVGSHRLMCCVVPIGGHYTKTD